MPYGSFARNIKYGKLQMLTKKKTETEKQSMYVLVEQMNKY